MKSFIFYLRPVLLSWQMCFFKESNTTLQAIFLAILLSATVAVCLNKIPSASTFIVMEVPPLLVDLMGFSMLKCSCWHSSFNSFAGWSTTVSGVIKGSKRGLILWKTISLLYPESTRMAPAKDSITSPSTCHQFENI